MISNISVLDHWLSTTPQANQVRFRALYPVMVSLLAQPGPNSVGGPIVDIETPLPEYDYVIVGGGSAGSVVASRLSEDPGVSVLLLEAGVNDKDEPLTKIPMLANFLSRTNIDWQYKAEKQDGACLGVEGQQCFWPRGKILGGTSTLNYMIYVRGNRRDFDQWEKLGNPGWDYESVLPYFIKSEDNRNRYRANDTRYHGKGGYMTVSDIPHKSPLTLSFIASAAELGYPVRDINGPEQTGFMLVQMTQRKGKRLNMAEAFLHPVRDRNNLNVVVKAMVDKVIFDKNHRATGVVFEKNGKMMEVKARKEIILSAGSIGSPAILMRSGVGPARHLRKHKIPLVHDSPGVGENLQDHIGYIAQSFLAPKGRGFHYEENEETYLKYLRTGRGPYTCPGVEALAFINTKYADPSGLWPDVQFHFVAGGMTSDEGRSIRKNFGFTDADWESYFKPMLGKEIFTVFTELCRPESVGSIKLRSKDFREDPIINANYFAVQRDVDILIEAFKFTLRMANTTAFRKVGAVPYDRPFPGCEQHAVFSDAYIECFLRRVSQSVWHPVGTAKMGPDRDPMAVVDPELRVRGVKGLRVVDGSVMPKLVSGNTNAAIVMIAEKASDMIKGVAGPVSSARPSVNMAAAADDAGRVPDVVGAGETVGNKCTCCDEYRKRGREHRAADEDGADGDDKIPEAA